MKNAVVWGFDHESVFPAIIALEEQRLIKIKAWIGEKDVCKRCTHDINDFFAGNIIKEKYEGCKPDLYNHVYSSLYKFMDMFTRRNFPYDDKNIHEYLHVFNMFVDFFDNFLATEEISIVMFANIPHEGPDLILYEIAKQRGIKTVVCYQSLFPNKFFYMFDTDDFGKFQELETNENNDLIKIEQRFEKELFYMNDVSQKTKIPPIKMDMFLNFAKVLKKLSYTKMDRIIQLISQRYERYQSVVRYNANLLSSTVKDISLDSRYVYFPLHLQPELTTSALGGIYSDQLLAIEHLSNILPPEFVIYVKENPKQTEFMRGQWFFDRLKKIDQVKMVSPQVNTYMLMKHCTFVATITGTAGWEAISGGKNVLVFGNPWYKSLPGVFTYDAQFKLENILNNKINHNDLENQVNNLLGKMGTGVIDPAYLVMLNNFSKVGNSRSLFNTFARILK